MNKITNTLLAVLLLFTAGLAYLLFSISNQLSALCSEQRSAVSHIENTAKLSAVIADRLKENSSEMVNKTFPVCMAFDASAIEDCAPGSKIIFLPMRWGNDQLPIIVAGNHCDFNYSVVYNNGGVACIKNASETSSSEDAGDSQSLKAGE